MKPREEVLNWKNIGGETMTNYVPKSRRKYSQMVTAHALLVRFEMVLFFSVQTSPKSVRLLIRKKVKSRGRGGTSTYKKIKLKNSLRNESQHKATQHVSRMTEHPLRCQLHVTGWSPPTQEATPTPRTEAPRRQSFTPTAKGTY